MKKNIFLLFAIVFTCSFYSLNAQTTCNANEVVCVDQTSALDGNASLQNQSLQTSKSVCGFENYNCDGLGLNLLMILIGVAIIVMGIFKKWEPLYLIPIGVGIIIGNVLLITGIGNGGNDQATVLGILFQGLKSGLYPALIFLGIGAMTDFSTIISNPKLMLIGAAAQIGVFCTFLGAFALGFTPQEAGAIGLIGGAEGSTVLYLASKLTPENLATIAFVTYLLIALVPLIQTFVLKLLVNNSERKIQMKQPRAVSFTEKIIFPLASLVVISFITPHALPLLGMLFLGNILKESGVTEKLAETARTSVQNIVIVLIGLTVGVSLQGSAFISVKTFEILLLGLVAIIAATVCGVLFAKLMNVFLDQSNKINPLIGCAGVSASTNSAKVAQNEALKADPNNHLLIHAMAPNIAGIIASAVAAGIFLSAL